MPIIVVRRADGLPSGGYDPERIASETVRVFDHDWAAVTPPTAADLARFSLSPPPAGRRAAAFLAGAVPC